MDRVRTHPKMRLTLDWVAMVEAAGSANEGLTDDQRCYYAHADLHAVGLADVLWLLAPSPSAPSTGAWVELGYALRAAPRVIVSGPARTRSIFCALGEEYDSDDEAWTAIVATIG